jgi:hypothetical protein
MVLLAHPLLGSFDRQPMIAGEGFHPGLVVGGPLAQDLLADHRNADHLTEEVHNLLRARETAEVAVNDNAVEAVVDKGEQVAEQLGEQFHGNPRTARSRAKNHQAWTGQADRGGQEFSSGRCGALCIQRRAGNYDSRIVTIGQLILFSTKTGDAWLLDPADQLAARLAREGESEPIQIEETDTTFAIGWKGRYRIEGPAFVYPDDDTGRVTTILGYPTDKLTQAV